MIDSHIIREDQIGNHEDKDYDQFNHQHHVVTLSQIFIRIQKHDKSTHKDKQIDHRCSQSFATFRDKIFTF